MSNQKRGQWQERTVFGALPCPFCGHGTPVLQRELREGFKPTSRDPERFSWSIRCLGCATVGPWKKSDTSALQWWNIRANSMDPTVASAKVLHTAEFHIVGDRKPIKVPLETIPTYDEMVANAPEGTYKFRRVAFQTAKVVIRGQEYEMICALPAMKTRWLYMRTCRQATVQELLLLGEITTAAKLGRGEIVVLHVPGGMIEVVEPGTSILLPNHWL